MAVPTATTVDRSLAWLLSILSPLWSGELPGAALAQAKLALADYVGTALAGAQHPSHAALAAALLRSAPVGACAVFGNASRSDLMTAVFLNASAGPVLELDDRLPEVRLHPGIHVGAVAIGCAEEQGLSGLALLRGVIVGYEATFAVGALFPQRPDWLHPHGYLSTVGAAVAAAQLRGLSLSNVPDVASCAAAITPLAPMDAAWQGATIRNSYPGFACQAALRAVDCVAGGMSGLKDALPGLARRLGLADVAAPPPAPSGLAIERTELKLLPCCASIHPYLLALRRLRARLPDLPIERITVAGPARLAPFMNARPENLLAAQFSLPFVLAHEVRRGLPVDARLDPGDAEVRDFASRVEHIVDAAAPRVIVTASDGRTACEPATAPETAEVRAGAVEDKFLRLNASRPALAERLWHYVMNLDGEERVRLPLV